MRPSLPELRWKYAIPIDDSSVQICEAMNTPNAILETIFWEQIAMVYGFADYF